jgi:hypothetical protein
MAQDLSSNKSLNLTFNTNYNYRIRIELSNISSCFESLTLYEHGQYILNVQSSSTNSSSNLTCRLTTQRSANNIYIPLIIGGVLLLVLFVFCIFAQRMKLREHLLNLKNHCFKNVPPQEPTHSYDLQVCPPTVINTTDANPSIPKLPPIHKVSNVIVPRSKRLLSLDAFRGFGKENYNK